MTRCALLDHEQTCPHRLVECECGATLKAKDLHAHWENECASNERRCNYRRFGCRFRGCGDALRTHLEHCPFGHTGVREALLMQEQELVETK